MKIIDTLRLALTTTMDEYTHSRKLCDLPARIGDVITTVETKMREARTANELVELIRCEAEGLATDWVSVLFGTTEESRLKRAYLKVLNSPKFSDLKLLVATNHELMVQNETLAIAVQARGGDRTIQNRIMILESKCSAYERQLSELHVIRDRLITKGSHMQDLLDRLGDEPGFEALVRRSKLTLDEQDEVLHCQQSRVAQTTIPMFARSL